MRFYDPVTYEILFGPNSELEAKDHIY